MPWAHVAAAARSPIYAPKLSHVRFRIVLSALAVLALMATPLAAQEIPGDPSLAPAIARWAGATRGAITETIPGDNSITLSAVARDPDSAQAIDYEILVDGSVAVRGSTERPTGFGMNASFDETIQLSPGEHRVCLRLDDRSLGMRTVHCRDAITEPPDRVDAPVAAAATGVAVSETGVVLPITGGTSSRPQVLTPCGNSTTLTNSTIVERARVVIDPGHGGSESGAVGAGLLEKNVNLIVSERVVAKLEALGIPTVLTRTADYRVPIRTRADIATALAPDVFLSLHHNGGAVRRSSVPGTEIFYAQGRPDSERLAAILYEELFEAASQFDAQWVSTVNQGASVRLRDDGLDLFGIHRFSPGVDSVITEFLYLSNPSEAQLMNSPVVVEAQAQAIVDGIVRWWFGEAQPDTPGRRFVDPSSSGTGGFDGCVDPALNGPSPLSASRADVLSEANSGLADRSELPRLLPALQLGADPAIG